MMKVEKQAKETKSEPEPMVNYSIVNLTNFLGLDGLQIRFLFGESTVRWRFTGPKRFARLKISHALLCRYLLKWPQYNPLPKLPTATEFFNFIKQIDPELTIGHVGIYLGVGMTSAYNWEKGRNQTPLGTRIIMFTLMKAVNKDGPVAWERYKKVVEEEARSRGTSVQKLIKKTGWFKLPHKEGELVMPLRNKRREEDRQAAAALMQD